MNSWKLGIDNAHEMVYNHAYMKRLNLLVTDEQYAYLNQLPNKSEVIRQYIQSLIDGEKSKALEKRVESLERRVEKLDKKVEQMIGD